MVVPLDTVEQDPDMEVMDKKEGPDSVAEVAVEGSAAPVQSDPGENNISSAVFAHNLWT